MDLAHPIDSVIPCVHGPVLEVLARSGDPLSGREVAARTRGRASPSRTSTVLAALVDAGLVLEEVYPSIHLYRLNPDHLATPGIVALAHQKEELVDRIRRAVEGWDPAPVAVWLYGSTARGDARPDSDVDLLVVRPDEVDPRDEGWFAAVAALHRSVVRWTGNGADVQDVSLSDVHEEARLETEYLDGLIVDAVTVYGPHPVEVVGTPAVLKRLADAWT